MNNSQKKVAKIIVKKSLSFEEANQINSSIGWLSKHKDNLRLQKDQLEEAYVWAAQKINKKRKNQRRIYLTASIISFLLVPFAFSGLLDPSPYIAWIGQLGLGMLLVISGLYFWWEYWKISKK